MSLHLNWPDEDRQRRSAALQSGSAFDTPGRASRWSDATKYQTDWIYDYWLRFLRQYYPDTLLEDPGARITPDRIAAFVRYCGRTAGAVTLSNYVSGLVRMFQAMDPHVDWRWVKEGMATYLQSEEVRKAPKTSPIFVDSLVLYELGIQLMKDARSLEGTKLDQSISYRDGLMIAMLAARPMRRRNLAMIQLGKHLTLEVGHFVLRFEPSETKTGRELVYQMPGDLTERIDRYIGCHRPDFPGHETHTGLWASAKGCQMTPEACYVAVTKRTEQALGFHVSPHDFRRSAATTIAERSPEAVLMSTRLLGHSDPRMTEVHYNRAQGVKAADTYQSLIGGLRSADPDG